MGVAAVGGAGVGGGVRDGQGSARGEARKKGAGAGRKKARSGGLGGVGWRFYLAFERACLTMSANVSPNASNPAEQILCASSTRS